MAAVCPPKETILSFFSQDDTADIVPVLARVQAPTLVTHGTHDRRVSLEAARYLAESIPGAQLHLFEGRGHLPIFTVTGEFCDVWRRFVLAGDVPAATG